MKCVDCGNSIPGFESYPDIEEVTYDEASDILDAVGMIDFPLGNNVRDVIILGTE